MVGDYVLLFVVDRLGFRIGLAWFVFLRGSLGADLVNFCDTAYYVGIALFGLVCGRLFGGL